MTKAIDTLIECIKEDIERTEGPVMQNFLGRRMQAERLLEYRRSLTRALRHRYWEDMHE